jgi:spore coat protein CotH
MVKRLCLGAFGSWISLRPLRVAGLCGLAWGIAGAGALAGCGSGGGEGVGVVNDDGGADGPDPTLAQRPDPAMPIFDEGHIHQIELQMTPDDWTSIINDTEGDTWRHATLTYDGVVIPDVGVHPSGESSRFAGNQKMAIRIKFDAFSGRGKFGGIKEINVKGEYDDTSMMRERLAQYVFRQVMPTPEVVHGRMVVNGDLRGLFSVRESWDDDAIKTRFTPPVGPLYRLRPGEKIDPYVYLGDNPGLYVPLPWEPHIDKPSRGDDVIGSFLSVLNATPAQADQVADMNDLVTYLACSAVTMITDGFVGDTGVADHFQYFDPQSGRFFILSWDTDNTWSSQGEKPDRSIFKSFGTNKLSTAVRDVAAFHAQYVAKIAEVMKKVPAAQVQAQADTIYNLIRDTAHEDPIKSFSNATFDWSVGYVKDFVPQRYGYLQTQVGGN